MLFIQLMLDTLLQSFIIIGVICLVSQTVTLWETPTDYVLRYMTVVSVIGVVVILIVEQLLQYFYP